VIPTVLPWLHHHSRGITATNVPITAGITVVLPQSPSPCQSLIPVLTYPLTQCHRSQLWNNLPPHVDTAED